MKLPKELTANIKMETRAQMIRCKCTYVVCYPIEFCESL